MRILIELFHSFDLAIKEAYLGCVCTCLISLGTKGIFEPRVFIFAGKNADHALPCPRESPVSIGAIGSRCNWRRFESQTRQFDGWRTFGTGIRKDESSAHCPNHGR